MNLVSLPRAADRDFESHVLPTRDSELASVDGSMSSFQLVDGSVSADNGFLGRLHDVPDDIPSELSMCESSASMASAGRGPRCFPPGTVFQRKGGALITASQLRRHGGDVLMGPDSSTVRVLRAKTHQKEPRWFTTVETGESKLEVTSDHRLLVCSGPGGECRNAEAGRLQSLHVRTGTHVALVENVSHDLRESEVVEVTFEDDAPVLAWTRTARRLRNLDHGRAFAVRGAESAHLSDVLQTRNTFIDGPQAYTPPVQRSRSEESESTLNAVDQRRLARARGNEWSKPRGAASYISDERS